MGQTQPDKDVGKKLRIIMASLLGLIIILALIVVYLNSQPGYTQEYHEKLPANVSNLLFNVYDINSTINETTADYNLDRVNLIIIDARGLEGCSECQYKQGHLPGAIRDQSAQNYYNTTQDILVYSKDGENGTLFCSWLVGHVYGNIYNLEGGYEAWLAEGYPIKTGL